MTKKFERPGDIDVKVLNLTSLAHGTEMDLKGLVSSISIRESIFENCTTATIDMADGGDLPQYFPLIGEEEINIIFTTDDPSYDIEYVFHIHKISEKKQISNNTVSYSIECCKPDFLNSISQKISKSYKQQTIDSIVEDIAINDFSLGNKPVNIVSNTINIEHIVFPYMEPLQCINMLCMLAHPSEYSMATYLFYEDSKEYKFSSMEDIVSQEPYKTPKKFTAVLQNIDRTKDNSREQSLQGDMAIEEYSFSDPAPDLIRQIGSGSRNSTTLSLDTLTKSTRKY